MDGTVCAYRIEASRAFGLADASTFWETLHLHGVRIGSLDPEYTETMALLPDYGADCGIPISDGRVEEGGIVIFDPPGTEIVCYLTPHELKVVRSRWSKRRDLIADGRVRTCFQFIADLSESVTNDSDRVFVVASHDARGW